MILSTRSIIARGCACITLSLCALNLASANPATGEPHWNTRYDFTASRLPGAKYELRYYLNNRSAARPMPPGKSAQDYAIAFQSICKELHVVAKRQGTSVYIVGALAGYSPVRMNATTLDEHSPQ